MGEKWRGRRWWRKRVPLSDLSKGDGECCGRGVSEERGK